MLFVTPALFLLQLVNAGRAVRQDDSSLLSNELPGDVITEEGFQIKRGPNVPVPGLDGEELPLQWQIEHYVALLRDKKLFSKFALGYSKHYITKLQGWPMYHELYKHFMFLSHGKGTVNSMQVREYIARYTLVMKIWLLQALRGLYAGRLGKEMKRYFVDDLPSTRAYLIALLGRMYAAFGHISYQFSPDQKYFGAVNRLNHTSCLHNNYEKSDDFYVMHLGQAFFKQAAHSLRSWDIMYGSRPGTLMHEVSHLVKDEKVTLHRAEGWRGDRPGVRCGDDGRLGTSDYAYGSKVRQLNARNARHNADSVQFFIERSILAEIDDGHAIEIDVDGNVRTTSTTTTSSTLMVTTTSRDVALGLRPHLYLPLLVWLGALSLA